jgi:hypothetical protein
VGPRAGLDDVEKRKCLSLQGLEPCSPIVHPVASGHADCAEVSLRKNFFVIKDKINKKEKVGKTLRLCTFPFSDLMWESFYCSLCVGLYGMAE